jgi:putative RNA 2'-phosphotransferase
MISNEENKKLSKLLSYVLRHHPEMVNIRLDKNGWTSVKELLYQLKERGYECSKEVLEHVVNNNTKNRFGFNKDRTLIRANQGHSIEVDLGYSPLQPPEVLFHGTTKKNLQSIRENGIKKMDRHHVHLSQDRQTAREVGQRYGQPVILEIQAGIMHKKGFDFYLAHNEIWLTDTVPPEFIKEI